MRLPVARMFGHTVTIKAFTGEGATGPQYAAEVAESCRINDGRRFGQSPERAEVVAETVIYLRAAAVCPVRSLVTLPDGRQVVVVRSVPRNGGALATPAHLEVVVQ